MLHTNGKRPNQLKQQAFSSPARLSTNSEPDLSRHPQSAMALPLSEQTMEDAKSLLPYHGVDSTLRSLAGQAEGFGRHAIGGLHGEIYHVTTLEGTYDRRLFPPLLFSNLSFLSSIFCLQLTRRISQTTAPALSARAAVGASRCGSSSMCRARSTSPPACACRPTRRARAARHAVRQGPAAAGVRARRRVLPGGGARPRARRRRGPGEAPVQARVGGPMQPARLRRRPRRHHQRQHGRDRLAAHDKAVLIGGSSSHVEDRCVRATIHHCFFDGTRQRHPRVRFGRVHLYNNYTRDWGIYAVCASV
jgi:pectate lyase